MRFLGIIPDKVFHKFPVEVIWFIQIVDIKANALLLDGSIEALKVAVRFGMPGVIKEVGQILLKAEIIEVFGKLATIVRLDSPGDKGSHIKELPEEITAVRRRVSLVCIGKGEAGSDIDGSEDIAL
jgi:hypothetical protein